MIHNDSLQILEDLQTQSRSSISDKDIDTLQQEILDLTKELNNKKDQLSLLSKKESSLTKESEAKQNLKEKKTATKNSASQWIILRTSLVNKIKKARLELQNLEIQSATSSARSSALSSRASSRGQVRSSLNAINSVSSPKSPQNLKLKSNNSNKLAQKIEFSEEEAKAALASELEALKSFNTSFLDHSIETEIEYQDQLNQQIQDMQNITEQISRFKEFITKLTTEQENQAAQTDQIALLKEELSEIRKSLL